MKLDNSPARFDFPITLEGDTFRGWVMELKESGNPIDLTGAEVSLEVKARKGGPLILDIPATVIDPLGGQIAIPWFTTDAQAYSYLYDLTVRFPDGLVQTFITGELRFKKKV